MLNKKREQKAKLELSGKPDKGNQASVEVVEVSKPNTVKVVKL
jgi:hypothetical protein